MQPDIDTLAQVVLTTLQFNAFVVTLLFGFQGFAVARLWKENRLVPPANLFWLVFGLAATTWALILVANGHRDIAAALSRHRVLAFYTTWLDTYWHFYVVVALASFLSAGGFAVALRTGG